MVAYLKDNKDTYVCWDEKNPNHNSPETCSGCTASKGLSIIQLCVVKQPKWIILENNLVK